MSVYRWIHSLRSQVFPWVAVFLLLTLQMSVAGCVGRGVSEEGRASTDSDEVSTLVVLNHSRRSVTALNPATGQMINEVKLPAFALDIAAIDRESCVVTLCGRPTDAEREHSLLLINVLTGQVVRKLELTWPNPQYLAYDKGAQLVVVTHGYELPGKGCPVSIVDLVEYKQRDSLLVPAGTVSRPVVGSGETVYVRVGGGGPRHYGFDVSLAAIDISTSEAKLLFSKGVAEKPFFFQVGPNGELWATATDGTTGSLLVFERNPDGDWKTPPSRIVELGSLRPDQVQFCGDVVCVNDYNGLALTGDCLVLKDLQTGAQRLVSGLPTPRDIVVDPATRMVYVVAMTAGEVAAVEVDSGEIAWRTNLGGWPAALDIGF